MKYLKILAFLPAIFMMIVIWGFSDSNAEKSSSLSLEVTKIVVDGIDKISYDTEYTKEEKENLIEKLHTPVRKVAHVTEYAILAVTILLPLYLFELSNKKRIIITSIVSVVYAISDEIHQIFIPERAGRISDVLIDSIGICIGIMSFLGILKAIKIISVKK